MSFLPYASVWAAAMFLVVPAAAQDLSPKTNWLEQQFTPDSQSWLFNAEAYGPTLYNRDIHLFTFEAARAWHFPSGFEVQLRGGLGHTAGGRTDDPPDGEGRDSTTTGMTGGAALRYDIALLERVHLFAEGSMEFYWAQGQPFPSGGSAIDGLLRGGGGISYDLGPRFALELDYHAAHISNGGKPPQNPTWEGEGGGITLRYRL